MNLVAVEMAAYESSIASLALRNDFAAILLVIGIVCMGVATYLVMRVPPR